MAEFDHIAVPVDGSEGSLRAARLAARLSTALGIPVKLTYVVVMTPESAMGLSQLSKEQVEEIQRKRADAVLARAREALEGVGDASLDVVMSGDPAEEILRYIDDNPDCLVVMGRRGLSPVKTLMLGSVSEKVLRHASGVVTLVN